MDVPIGGRCDPAFAPVREVFEENFRTQGEVGAAVCVVIENRVVVDLWGGWMDAERTRPWGPDTIVNTYSTTKGIVATLFHRIAERGLVDLDAPVAQYWPEFATGGKERLPVRYLLSHQAGLAAISKPLPPGSVVQWETMVAALAEQEPWWEPGTAHGYHALTFGFLVGEVLRRVTGKSVGRLWREEIAGPLELDFFIGFGPELDERTATLLPAPPPVPGQPDIRTVWQQQPDSLAARAFNNPPPGAGVHVNSRAWRAAEIPAGNGHGSARAVARLYGALAAGGAADGVRVLAPETVERARQEQASGTDQVLPLLKTRFALGYWLAHPEMPVWPTPNCFGHPGMGGSCGFADPDAKLGFGYVMNQMKMGIAVGGTGQRLIEAVYRCLGR
ncbi:Esterase EstB [bacterium HR29]|mgnify:FL=1|jgi:CubicO group peptidase (beta-lactamase class C family)|nr:Esterase EstB [bacterium HR29]